MNESGRALRGFRAVVFAVTVLALSAAAHVLVTGAPLPLATLALSGGALLVVSFLLARGERGFGAIAGALVPLELALNASWNLGQAQCLSVGTHPGGLPGLLLCGGEPGSGLLIGPGLAQDLAPTAPTLALLLAAHLAVGLLAAAWLRRGEALLHRAAQALAALGAPVRGLLTELLRRLGAVLPAPEGAALPLRPRHEDRAARLPQDVLLRTATRRGPPACALA